MNSEFIELKTIDGNSVVIRHKHVSAVLAVETAVHVVTVVELNNGQRYETDKSVGEVLEMIRNPKLKFFAEP